MFTISNNHVYEVLSWKINKFRLAEKIPIQKSMNEPTSREIGHSLVQPLETFDVLLVNLTT